MNRMDDAALNRAQIFYKPINRFQEIDFALFDSEGSISPAHVAWRTDTSNRVVVPARQAGNRYLGSLKG
jgi:hypothetical protein